MQVELLLSTPLRAEWPNHRSVSPQTRNTSLVGDLPPDRILFRAPQTQTMCVDRSMKFETG